MIANYSEEVVNSKIRITTAGILHLPPKSEAAVAKTTAKIEKFDGYFKCDDESDKQTIEQDAYNSFAKGLKIGSLAAGSTPHLQDEKLEVKDISNFQTLKNSLHRKHLSRLTKENKIDPNDISDKYYRNPPKIIREDTAPPRRNIDVAGGRIRQKYGNVGTVHNYLERGYLYAMGRSQKYLDRHGMKDAALQEIKRKLGIETSSSDIALIELLEISQTQLKNSLASMNIEEPLQFCLKSLIEGYFSENEMNFKKEDDEVKLISEVILLIEVKNLIDTSLHKSLPKKVNNYVEDYDLAVSMMNLAILNTLERNEWKIKPDNYYQKLLETYPINREYISDTHTDTSGSNTKDKILTVLDSSDSSKMMQGFPLPICKTEDQFILSKARKSSGYYLWSNNSANDFEYKKRQAFLGRATETTYHMTKYEKIALLNEVKKWVSTPSTDGSTLPKMLLIDLTIEHANADGKEDILELIFKSNEIIEFIENGLLEIALVKSEQKQATLGTGKLAAGSGCIISKSMHHNDDRNIKKRILTLLSSEKTPDLYLADFYRKYTSESRKKLIEKQCELAENLAKELNSKFKTHYFVANGTVVFDLTPSNIINSHKLIMDKNESSDSFGFLIQSWTEWSGIKSRIVPNYSLDSKNSELSHELSIRKIIAESDFPLSEKDIELIKRYISDYDVNQEDEYGLTPFLRATGAGRADICSLLLDNGAKVLTSEITEKSPIFIAYEDNNSQLFSLFYHRLSDAEKVATIEQLKIRKRSDLDFIMDIVSPDIKNILELRKLLFLASIIHKEIVICENLYAIDPPLNLDEIQKDGETYLTTAAKSDLIQSIDFLIKNKAKIRELNAKGETPLEIATDYARLEIIQLLIENGADVNQLNANGNPLIFKDVIDLKAFEIFVNNGANLMATDKDGNIFFESVKADSNYMQIIFENKDSFNKLPKDYQNIVTEVINEESEDESYSYCDDED